MRTIFRSILLPVLLLCAAVQAFAQQENYNKEWILGRYPTFKTTFNTAGPVNTVINSIGYLDYSHSNICNNSGNLLLATDSRNICDGAGNIIDNGDTLVPTPYAYSISFAHMANQGSIILPLGDSIYYVFITAMTDTTAYYNIAVGDTYNYPGSDLLLYNVVDMKQNNYAGKVIKKNRVALDSTVISYYEMTAVRHANGHDWWLTKNGVDWNSDSNVLYTFWVQQDTVLGPYVQVFNQPITGYFNTAAFGQAAFSNHGDKYANVFNLANDYFFIADFDRCAGIFSNQQRIHIPHLQIPIIPPAIDSNPVSLCFSPNDSFLYVCTTQNIFQWEIYNPDSATAWVHIAGKDTTDAAFALYTSIYAGHDGKLYIGNYQSYFSAAMSVIDNPNVKGTGAGFCAKCLDFPPYNGFSGNVTQPPNMPNYVLGKDEICFTSVSEETISKAAFTIYPNPADASITVQSSAGGSFELVDMLGRVVLRAALTASQSKATLSTAELPAGVYAYRVMEGGRYAAGGKVVIKH